MFVSNPGPFRSRVNYLQNEIEAWASIRINPVLGVSTYLLHPLVLATHECIYPQIVHTLLGEKFVKNFISFRVGPVKVQNKAVMRKLQNTTPLQNDGDLQCNVLASLVHFDTYTTK